MSDLNLEELNSPEIVNHLDPKTSSGEGKDQSQEKVKHLKNKFANTENWGRISFHVQRAVWSVCIIVWISCLIHFDINITSQIGSGKWDFTRYRWFIVAVPVETFLQIVGLGYLATRFLFSDVKRKKKKQKEKRNRRNYDRW